MRALAVVMSQGTCNGLMETVHLLESPANVATTPIGFSPPWAIGALVVIAWRYHYS